MCIIELKFATYDLCKEIQLSVRRNILLLKYAYISKNLNYILNRDALGAKKLSVTSKNKVLISICEMLARTLKRCLLWLKLVGRLVHPPSNSTTLWLLISQ